MSMTTPLAAPNGFSVTSLITNLAAALRLLGSFTAPTGIRDITGSESWDPGRGTACR